ncbi:MAG: hypothetical protein QM627_05135 [Luteolibacter sp.]
MNPNPPGGTAAKAVSSKRTSQFFPSDILPPGWQDDASDALLTPAKGGRRLRLLHPLSLHSGRITYHPTHQTMFPCLTGAPAGVPAMFKLSRTLAPAEITLLHVLVGTAPSALTMLPPHPADPLAGERFVIPLGDLAAWRRCCRELGLPTMEDGFGLVLQLLRGLESVMIVVSPVSVPEELHAVPAVELDEKSNEEKGSWTNVHVVLRPRLIHFLHPVPDWENRQPSPICETESVPTAPPYNLSKLDRWKPWLAFAILVASFAWWWKVVDDYRPARKITWSPFRSSLIPTYTSPEKERSILSWGSHTGEEILLLYFHYLDTGRPDKAEWLSRRIGNPEQQALGQPALRLLVGQAVPYALKDLRGICFLISLFGSLTWLCVYVSREHQARRANRPASGRFPNSTRF